MEYSVSSDQYTMQADRQQVASILEAVKAGRTVHINLNGMAIDALSEQLINAAREAGTKLCIKRVVRDKFCILVGPIKESTSGHSV